jgi:hypothetical protein
VSDPITLAREASTLVNGDRGNKYGHPLENHERIARLWNARLHEKLIEPLTVEDVVSLMRLLKEARLIETPGHRDSLVDLIGYVMVEERIQRRRAGVE